MVAPVEINRKYSLSEYFEFGVNEPARYEYINGKVVPITDITINHNQISSNLYAILNFAFKNQFHDVFIADQRLWVLERRIATYPDILVVSGKSQLQEGREDTIINPLMIAEVSSSSISSHSQDEKFAAYRTIGSFQEYILIDQYSTHIEHYHKTVQGNWVFSEYRNSTDIIGLSCFPLQISLADIYDRVGFNLVGINEQ